MTIEITKREVEALIKQRIQSGAFARQVALMEMAKSSKKRRVETPDAAPKRPESVPRVPSLFAEC